MKNVAIIFPNQLFKNITFEKSEKIYLVEEWLYFNQYRFHKQKIAFHRATLKFYAAYLTEKGYKVAYINATEQQADLRKLLAVLKQDGVKKITVYKPVDNWLEKRLREEERSFQLNWLENPLFINTDKDLEEYFKKDRRHFHQTDFYKQQRKKRQILMDGSQPEGQQWC